jgi:hypothetical protein
MKIQISQNDVFCRQVSIEPIEAMQGQFCLQFDSLLRSAKDPQALKRNFQAIVSRDDVLALRDVLDSALHG